MRACLLSLNNLRRGKTSRSYEIRSYREKNILKFKIAIQSPGRPLVLVLGSVVSSSLPGCSPPELNYQIQPIVEFDSEWKGACALMSASKS